MWCEAGIETRYGYFAIHGAREGRRWAAENYDAMKVNDFVWLEDKFKEWIGLDGNR